MISQKHLLSIVIPCYNEKDTIEKVLGKIEKLSLIEGIGKEVVVVDDCSFDGTREILKKYEGIPGFRIFYHEINQGKGGALITGFKNIKGQIAIIQDADLEYNPSEIVNLLKVFLNSNEEKVVVYGSRNITKNPAAVSYYKIGAILITKFFNFLFGQKISDLYTCYKMFPALLLEKLNLKENSFNFEVEFTCQTIKNGYQIKEIPISYYPRKFSEGKKIRWWHGIQGILTIIKERLT